MVASQQWHEHGSRGLSIVGNCYIATTSEDIEDFVCCSYSLDIERQLLWGARRHCKALELKAADSSWNTPWSLANEQDFVEEPVPHNGTVITDSLCAGVVWVPATFEETASMNQMKKTDAGGTTRNWQEETNGIEETTKASEKEQMVLMKWKGCLTLRNEWELAEKGECWCFHSPHPTFNIITKRADSSLLALGRIGDKPCFLTTPEHPRLMSGQTLLQHASTGHWADATCCKQHQGRPYPTWRKPQWK